MKKQILRKSNLLVFCCLLCLNQTLSAQTIEECYVNMPDILNATLSKRNRLELLEYHKAHQSDSVANRFGNQTHLVSLDSLNQRIVVRNTASSTFEMKILSLEDSTKIIGIIRSVCAPVCLSTVEFYDTAWNAMPIQFTMPKAIEWMDEKSIPTHEIDLQWVRNVMDVSFVSLSFSVQGQSLVAKNNTMDFLSEQDRKLLNPYVVKKTISFSLKNRIWVQE